MPRNLVICCDGTNNQFGPENTNIVRLVQALDRDPSRQRLYYDPGVGTLPEPGVWSAAGKAASQVFGLAFGAGITWKVEQAYHYLMDDWQPGDRVFLIGFSRGSYTARIIAAVLHALGLLPRGNHNLVRYMLRLFKALRRDEHGSGYDFDQYTRLCDEFRWTFARPVVEGSDERRFPVYFLGLWDTVSSVGWVWDPPAYPYTTTNPSVKILRHAVSIDERRAFFRQNLIHRATAEQNVRELWFAGVHSDVGGGYPESEGGLWREPFNWMISEARAEGLLLDEDRLQRVLTRTEPSPRPCLDPQHESLTAKWWPAEFFPKLQWRNRLRKRVPVLNRGHHRVIPDGASIHRCALERLCEKADYRPPNLSPAFIDDVRALSVIPDSLAYRRSPTGVFG